VHLRGDMELWELDYLVDRFKVKVFNTHTEAEHPLINDLSKYYYMIFIENIYLRWDKQELKHFAGLCLDFTHLENDRLTDPEKYKFNLSMIEKFKIGCNHLSVIKKKSNLSSDGQPRFDDHTLTDLKQLDYLKKYPKNYFSSFVAIELTNSMVEQLAVKDYLKHHFLNTNLITHFTSCRLQNHKIPK